MKIRIFLFAALIVSGYVANACDVCGGGGGGSLFGILPQYQKHFIGFRYKYSAYQSTHHDESTYGNDYMNTAELWGRYSVTDRLHFYAMVPYQFVKRDEDGVISTMNELSDITVLANYILLDNSRNAQPLVKHIFQLGGGIKLPTGKSDIVRNFQSLPENLQPGSGTFDYLMTAVYTMRIKNYGLNADINYKYNTTNNRHYKQGNRFNASARFFAWYNYGSISLLPNVGIDYEHANIDTKRSQNVEMTGGKSVFTGIGVDVYYKSFAAGCRVQNAVYQHLNEGNTTGKWRVNAQILYLF